jgi:hypothetical protein
VPGVVIQGVRTPGGRSSHPGKRNSHLDKRSSHLVELMEHNGVVGPAQGSRPRELLRNPTL